MVQTTFHPASYQHPGGRQAWLRYAVAVLCVVLATLGRAALTPSIGPTALPFIVYFPFIAVAAWYGGWGPALLSILLACLASAQFFLESSAGIGVHLQDRWALAAFSAASLIIVSAIGTMHRTKAGLLQSHDLLSTTLASIGDGVIVTDAQGRVVFLNPVAERMTKWTSSEAGGQPVSKVFRVVNEDTRQPVEDPVGKVLRLGITVGLANHTVLIAKDGTVLPVDDSGAPIRHPRGALYGTVLIFRDATEQRKAQENRARLASIVENSGDVILSKDMEGRILTWNAAAERMFGYRAEEIVGKPVTTLLPPELQQEEVEIMERLRRGVPSERLETIRLTKDGRRIPVSVSVSPLKDPGGRVIGASKILHDISGMLASRQALVREKQWLSTTLASIGDGVILTDDQGRVTFLNKEAERLTGWTSTEAREKPLTAVFRIVNSDTRQIVENPVEKALRLGTIVGLANHTVLISRNGTETPIEDSAAPIREKDGPLFGVVLVFRDFTEQKKSRDEILRLNSDLERRVAERTRELRETIQELETFSYTVAHDLRGPLRTMHRSAEVLLLEQASHLPEEGSDFLQRIANSAGRMDQLIQDLLAYSRVTRSALQSVPVEPRLLLADLMVQLAPEIKERQADVRIGNDLGTVLADPVLLTQVFTNLLSNALKFVPRGTAPQVRIWAEPRDGFERIWIEDNGIGIDQRYRERLFRLFERLDSEYPGTGIGLAIVKRAVERMGGRVGFESGAGKGSLFWIEVRPAESHERKADQGAPRRG